MDNQFTPGQYVRVRGTIHEPWQVRIFVGWNERRPGSGAVPYARVMLKDGFQYDPNAATESFSMIEAWHPQINSWVWIKSLDNTQWDSWKMTDQEHEDYFSGNYYFGGDITPLTLPPFVAVGDKY